MGKPNPPPCPRWGVKMASPDDIQDILKQEGFHFEKLADSTDEVEALYIRPKAGGASTYVTVPVNCDDTSDEVLAVIMKTARIPRAVYVHLLNNP